MNVQNMIPVNISVMILLMFIVNMTTFGICVCRLRLLRKRALWRVKMQYIIGTVVSLANALAPMLFQQWPNGVAVLFATWVCYTLWSDGFQWKKGIPTAAILEKKDE
jgi:hypothetical protein